MCQPTSPPAAVTSTTLDENISSNKSLEHESETSTAATLRIARQTLEKGTLLACLSLLLLITGMSITFPHMQSRRDELGCDSLCYGSMTSARSALSLVGTAVVGRLSDKNGSFLARTLGSVGKGRSASGRRACLILGTVASLIGLTIAASMNSLHGLWLSMIPGALLQHNFEVYKALLSEYHNDIEHLETEQNKLSHGEVKTKDCSNESAAATRSGSVGKLGMSAGISFMIGPMIAAVASPTFQFASYIAIVCTLASGLVVLHLPMPVACTHENEKHIAEKTPSKNSNTEFTLMNMLKLRSTKTRAAMFCLVVRMNMALAFHIFNTIWPTSLKARFNFGPSDHARFMSFIGVTYAVSQGFVAKRLVQMWGQDGKAYVIMACCAVLGAGRYIAYYTESLLVVYATFLFIINALGTTNTIITADSGAIASSNEIGGLFGMLEASQSAAGMVGPFLGGLISHYLGKDAPLLGVVGVYGFLFTFVSWGYDRYVIKHEGGKADVKQAKKAI